MEVDANIFACDRLDLKGWCRPQFCKCVFVILDIYWNSVGRLWYVNLQNWDHDVQILWNQGLYKSECQTYGPQARCGSQSWVIQPRDFCPDSGYDVGSISPRRQTLRWDLWCWSPSSTMTFLYSWWQPSVHGREKALESQQHRGTSPIPWLVPTAAAECLQFWSSSHSAVVARQKQQHGSPMDAATWTSLIAAAAPAL